MTSTAGRRNDTYHRPVLADEMVHYLITRADGIYADLTCGGGGHLGRIAENLERTASLIGIDRDPEAIAAAGENLKIFSSQLKLINATFGRVDEVLAMLGHSGIDGVLIDLGVSSHQIDTAFRGFSFMKEGPLDMRMDSAAPLTAREVVNSYSEEEIVTIFREYGEERRARRMARAIIDARRRQNIATTTQLADILKPLLNPREINSSLARLFQAIRIEVNKELEELDKVLPKLVSVLKPGGRGVVIAYHSLEDRKVKRFFAQEAKGCICPPRLPVCQCGRKPTLKILTRKAVKPTEEEISGNSRAKSAKLRAIEKI